MIAAKTSELSSQFFGVIFFAIVAITMMAIAKRKGYFSFSPGERKVNLNHRAVISGFFLYLLINAFTSPVVLKVLSTQGNLLVLSIINIVSNVLVIIALSFVSLVFIKDQIKNIWKETSINHQSTYAQDIKIGIFSYFIVFPVVMFCSNFFELLLKFFFGIKNIPDQVAIDYVKMSEGNIGYFMIALITLVIFAPLIEEFLFRGLLQNYLRKLLGIKGGIILTSIIFSLFHFSPLQGYSNITIIISLFVLSLFLCFIYEKQQSLISPITLHATFNAISVINLLIFKAP